MMKKAILIFVTMTPIMVFAASTSCGAQTQGGGTTSYFDLCVFKETCFSNFLSILALIVSFCTLCVCYRQLKNANKSLTSQIQQLETERICKIESHKSQLLLLLQNLFANMRNLGLEKLGGDYNEAFFADQKKMEIRIVLSTAELKARTTNQPFIELLNSIDKTVSSYWSIQFKEKHSDKASEFEKYKQNLSNIIENLKNIKSTNVYEKN